MRSFIRLCRVKRHFIRPIWSCTLCCFMLSSNKLLTARSACLSFERDRFSVRPHSSVSLFCRSTSSFPFSTSSSRGDNRRTCRFEEQCSTTILVRPLPVYCRSPRWSSGHPRILLALVLQFDSHRGEVLNLFAKMQKQQKGSRAPTGSSVGTHNSTRVDQIRKC